MLIIEFSLLFIYFLNFEAFLLYLFSLQITTKNSLFLKVRQSQKSLL